MCGSGIIKTRDIVLKNLKWIVGDGQGISFWQDWWCGTVRTVRTSSLVEMHPGDHVESSKVADFISESKDWDLHAFNFQIPVMPPGTS